MSAYEYFEQRSGRPARLYGAFAFSLAHFSKIGFVLYLMALTLSSITGWDIVSLIIGVAAVMILYAMLGASKPSSRPTSLDLNSMAVVAVADFYRRVRPLRRTKSISARPKSLSS